MSHTDNAFDVVSSIILTDAVWKELKAGKLAIDIAEDDRGNSNVNEEFATQIHEFIVASTAHDKRTQSECDQTVCHIAQHQPEEDGVSDEHEEGRINPTVAWTTHSIGQQFHWFTGCAILICNRWHFLMVVVVRMSMTAAARFNLEGFNVNNRANG